MKNFLLKGAYGAVGALAAMAANALAFAAANYQPQGNEALLWQLAGTALFTGLAAQLKRAVAG